MGVKIKLEKTLENVWGGGGTVLNLTGKKEKTKRDSTINREWGNSQPSKAKTQRRTRLNARVKLPQIGLENEEDEGTEWPSTASDERNGKRQNLTITITNEFRGMLLKRVSVPGNWGKKMEVGTRGGDALSEHN